MRDLTPWRTDVPSPDSSTLSLPAEEIAHTASRPVCASTSISVTFRFRVWRMSNDQISAPFSCSRLRALNESANLRNGARGPH